MNCIGRLFTALFYLGLSVQVNAGTYVVKKGETLSGILYKNVPGRIYGPGNNLTKTKVLNPNLVSINRLIAGELLVLPEGNKGQLTQYEIDRDKVLVDHTPDTSKASVASKASNQNLSLDPPKSLVKEMGMKEANLKQSFSGGFVLSFESMNATDISSGASEIASSDLAYGIETRWSHHWTEDLEFYFDASLAKYKFEVAADKTLSESSFTKAYGGVGVSYERSADHSYEFAVGLNETFVLSSESSTSLKIDKVVIPSLSASGSHYIKKFRSGYSISGLWQVGGLLPSSQSDYSTELGSFWNIGASSNYEAAGRRFNISITYGQRSLETDNLKQIDKKIGINAGIGFKF